MDFGDEESNQSFHQSFPTSLWMLFDIPLQSPFFLHLDVLEIIAEHTVLKNFYYSG